MTNVTIDEIVKDLETNLKNNCCTKQLVALVNKSSEDLSMIVVKLYDKICDACTENTSFAFYQLQKISLLNNLVNRPKGIVCSDCSERGCDAVGCVISLIIDEFENTRFTKANKIEIYII